MMLQTRKRHILYIAITAAMVMGGRGYAQVLVPDLPRNRDLVLMQEQYQQSHYAVAAQSAKQYLEAAGEKIAPERQADVDKAKYYFAIAAIKAEMPGCDDDAIRIMKELANPAYNQRIAFTLGQYYFKQDNMPNAIPMYEQAGITNLNNEEIADAKFELAYCYFNDKQFGKAEPLLFAIKELKEGKYYSAGNYYYGLLAYNENKYKEALKCFSRIRDLKEYKAVVPYYIAEIYYFMGDRTKALNEAEAQIKSKEKSFYDNELHLLAAQCLFEEQKYKEARPYFDYYYKHAQKIRKQELYEIAYCDYRVGEWSAATEKFKLLSSTRDSLGQTSMYLLGDCYLKTFDKKSARNAFGICADMTYNEGQQEASMILYAKISYEMGYNDDALRQLNTLVKTFPRTHYKDEANTIISDLLIKTNNYTEALKHLDEVSTKDEHFRQVYQKANFGQAVLQYRDGDLKSAYGFLLLSLKYPVNAEYEAAAHFWKGEITYQQHEYADAITYEQQFINKKVNKTQLERISPQATTQHAYLTMGYASMELEKFSDAQNFFSQAQQLNSKDPHSETIAAVLEADAVFMQRNYAFATLLYDKIINRDPVNADYARYQKSILLGLQGKTAEKITLLNSIVRSTPPSAYVNHARYELAVTLIDADKYSDALPYLRELIDESKDKSFAPKAWMKTGFIHQQLNQTSQAIEAYKHVAIDYPASEDRMAALDALKNLYIQSNQPASYTQMLRDNNLPSADSSSIDSTYYAAAEAQFSNDKWEEARVGFTNYLQQYPNGIFAIKAHYYKAESNFQLKKYKEALLDYNVVLEGEWNDFFENSARHAAVVAYSQKNYADAYGYYMQLLSSATSPQTKEVAYAGLMLSGYNSGKIAEAGLYADSLMEMPGISAEKINDATFYKARAMQEADNADEAIKLYKQLSSNKNGEIAVESKYRIAELLLKQDKLKEAEKAANETIKIASGYDFWVVKSYILLADILAKGKDYFNAKATLESIVKHTKITELKQEAVKKLEEVKALEKKQSKLSEE